jgi:heme/copper-type cytochrome/quinol oxidase subunit 4
MNWYSAYGTGATLQGVEPAPDGRVEFTVWLSVFWVPLIPVSSWSAVYAGGSIGGSAGVAHGFADLQKIAHNPTRLARTFVGALVVVIAAVTPSWVMIERTNGRAATTLEMVFVFASVIWAAGLIFFFEYRRRKRLRGG